MPGPDTAARNQVEMVRAGWTEDRVDYLGAWGRGRIGDDAIDGEVQPLTLHGGHVHIVAGGEVLEVPENRRVAADAIDVPGNYRIAGLTRRCAGRVPEHMRPVGRVDGLRDRRIHQSLRVLADIHHRRINMNRGNA